MDAKELRIGSFYKAGIEFNGSIGAKLIFNDQREFILTKEKLILILQLNLQNHVHGIILNEEWLLKLGGKEVLNTGISFLINGVLIVISRDKILIQSEYSKTGTIVLLRENYNQVHSFQNLVFALTTQELIIKEPESFGQN